MDMYVDRIFNNLDKWRNFPSYQLERRADIFFSIYLEEFLESKGYQIQTIIPEFPIRTKTSNKSKHIDYLAKTKDREILMIELKTDEHSVDIEQNHYLVETKVQGFQKLLEDLKKIYSATNEKGKYAFLLRELKAANLIRFHVEKKSDVIKDFDRVEDNDWHDICIIYIKPKKTDDDKKIYFDKLFTFADFANFIGKKQDGLSQRFSKSLKRWAREPAGLL